MESKKGELTSEVLKTLKKNFESDPKNLLAASACAKTDPLDICLQRKVVEATSHAFTHKVDSEIKPVTNQKNTGTCWIFAALNAMRIAFVKQHQLEEFEFSQNYLFFWEKIERCNYFLQTIVSVLKRGENIDGRLISFLLRDPIADGGQWDMIVNIIIKYGVMPKKCFPMTFSSEQSMRLNAILKAKIREQVRDLNSMVQKGSSDEKLQDKIDACMNELYRVICICLSVPPETFMWEYYNKNKVFSSVGPITPLKFYEAYVKPFYDVENKICLVNDPRHENPYEKTYTVDCLGNMMGGRRTVYVNLKTDLLLKYTAESIKNNEPVWFGCEIGKMFYGKLGISDLKILDFKLLFDVELYTNITKAERLQYGDAMMNHAMVCTAVSLDANEEVTKLRVENSWGDDRGEKGYLIMTRDWFEEFGFEVVVDKQYVPKEVSEILKIEPKVLPAWDPMGSLAL